MFDIFVKKSKYKIIKRITQIRFEKREKIMAKRRKKKKGKKKKAKKRRRRR